MSAWLLAAHSGKSDTTRTGKACGPQLRLAFVDHGVGGVRESEVKPLASGVVTHGPYTEDLGASHVPVADTHDLGGWALAPSTTVDRAGSSPWWVARRTSRAARCVAARPHQAHHCTYLAPSD